MNAITLKGIFCGSDKKEFTRQSDGKHIVSYYLLVTNGADFYKVRSDSDRTGEYSFGDEVEIPVTANVYNGNIYWNYEE